MSSSVNHVGLLNKSMTQLSRAIRTGEITVTDLAGEIIKNQQLQVQRGHKNAYTQFSGERILRQALRLDSFFKQRRAPARDSFPPLFGLPVSIKDIFHQRGWTTTAGSAFLAEAEGIQLVDSEIVARCRVNGALFTGKTHLNEFAYGLTGENKTWGPCRNPKHPERLTGGSSSGAAATVLAGTALVGIGTDTGGSIRVPSALGGLVGMRLGPNVALSRGMIPLAPSFDTVGWVQRYLEDVPLVYSSLFRQRVSPHPRWTRKRPLRLVIFAGAWLEVCQPEIQQTYVKLAQNLESAGAKVRRISGDFLIEAAPLFAPIQAHEAARYHRQWLPQFAHLYDPAIRSRLEWGEGVSTHEYFSLQARRRHFVQQLNHLFIENHLLLAPASPFTRLAVGEDHSGRRSALLQMTTPFSLAGCPALTVPGSSSRDEPIGWQFIAPRGLERRLVKLAMWLGSVGLGQRLIRF